MATGPCGNEFREAFSCFHYSQEEPKGSECLPAFAVMQQCIGRFPELYPMKDDDEDDPLAQAISEAEKEKAEVGSGSTDETPPK